MPSSSSNADGVGPQQTAGPRSHNRPFSHSVQRMTNGHPPPPPVRQPESHGGVGMVTKWGISQHWRFSPRISHLSAHNGTWQLVGYLVVHLVSRVPCPPAATPDCSCHLYVLVPCAATCSVLDTLVPKLETLSPLCTQQRPEVAFLECTAHGITGLDIVAELWRRVQGCAGVRRGVLGCVGAWAGAWMWCGWGVDVVWLWCGWGVDGCGSDVEGCGWYVEGHGGAWRGMEGCGGCLVFWCCSAQHVPTGYFLARSHWAECKGAARVQPL